MVRLDNYHEPFLWHSQSLLHQAFDSLTPRTWPGRLKRRRSYSVYSMRNEKVFQIEVTLCLEDEDLKGHDSLKNVSVSQSWK